MEIIIFGLVVFIVGVLATIIYDKYKAMPKKQTPIKKQPDLNKHLMQYVNSKQETEQLIIELKRRHKIGESEVILNNGITKTRVIIKNVLKDLETLRKYYS